MVSLRHGGRTLGATVARRERLSGVYAARGGRR